LGILLTATATSENKASLSAQRTTVMRHVGGQGGEQWFSPSGVSLDADVHTFCSQRKIHQRLLVAPASDTPPPALGVVCSLIAKACTDLDTLTQQATLTSSATVEADAKAQINTTIAR